MIIKYRKGVTVEMFNFLTFGYMWKDEELPQIVTVNKIGSCFVVVFHDEPSQLKWFFHLITYVYTEKKFHELFEEVQ